MATETGENKYAKYGQPTLDLVFTGEKESLTDRVGNVGLEFTRSSTATYVGSDGLVKSAAVNEARFDHDKDGNGLGLLIEESRTNLVRTSTPTGSGLGNGWTQRANTTITTNADVAPDGTTTATSVVANLNSTDYAYTDGNLASATTAACVVSAFAKPINNLPSVVLKVGNSGGGSIIWNFNFQTGVATLNFETGAASGFGSTAFMEPLPNGWFRVGFTAAAGTEDIVVNGRESWSGTQPAADGVTGCLWWGCQIEEGSFQTSFIPTTGSTVTRAVDTVSLTGTNFSSWYNGSEGSIFIDMKRPVEPSSGAFLEFHNDAGLFLQDVNGIFTARIGQENNSITLGDPATTTDYKIASSYQSANDYKVSSNGSSVTSGSTSVDFTTATELHIGRGNNAFASHYRNGPSTLHLKQFTYWTTRLSDSDLQSLTE